MYMVCLCELCCYSSNFQTIPLIVQTPHLFREESFIYSIEFEHQKLNIRLITVLYFEEDAGLHISYTINE